MKLIVSVLLKRKQILILNLEPKRQGSREPDSNVIAKIIIK